MDSLETTSSESDAQLAAARAWSSRQAAQPAYADAFAAPQVRRWMSLRWALLLAACLLLVVALLWIAFRLQSRYFIASALATDWLLLWSALLLFQASDRFRVAEMSDNGAEALAGAAKVQQVAKTLRTFAVWGLGSTLVFCALAAYHGSFDELVPGFGSGETQQSQVQPQAAVDD